MAKKITVSLLKPKIISAKEVKIYEKAQSTTQHIKPDLVRDAGLMHVKSLFTNSEQNDVQFNDDGSITMGAITLDQSQARAVNGLLGVKFGALIGSAGTGKTTTTKAFVALLEKKIIQEKGEGYVPKGLFCAYTARATNIMAGKLPDKYRKNCMTVHKLLDYAPLMMETKKGEFAKIFKPKKSSENMIEADYIIIDEAGMLNFELWHEILESVTNEVIIILIGDIAQLPPVMGLSPLPIAMKKAACYELTTVHRQALNSPIIAAATAVKEGRKPVTAFNHELGSSIAFGHLESSDRQGNFDSAIFAHKFINNIKAAYEQGRFDPWLDIVLSPVLIQFGGAAGLKEYHASCTSLNSVLRGILNPDTKDKPRVIIHGSPHSLSVSTIGLNDKLLLLKNGVYANVHPQAVGLTVAVANGMLARVTDIQLNTAYVGEGKQHSKEDFTAASKISVDAGDLLDFDMNDDMHLDITHNNEKLERQCSHVITIEIIGLKNAAIQLRTAGDFSSLLYGYAITVYKAQGGEYRNVYLALQREGTARLATREMLYTAITRASQNVVVYHDGITLLNCIKNASLKGVTVAEKADNIMQAVATKDPAKIPKMPWDYEKTGNVWHTAK